jgi:hypothetical protein
VEPVVQRQALEDRQVELVRHQGAREMPRQRRVPLEGRDASRTDSFVRDRVFVADPQREGRIVVEEERAGVVVEAEEEDVGLLLGEPCRHRPIGLEQRRPGRVLLPGLVERHADGGYVGAADAADDAGHALL